MIRQHYVFSEAAASADGTDGQCTEHGYEHLLGWHAWQGRRPRQISRPGYTPSRSWHFPGLPIYLLSTAVSFCGDVGVDPEVSGSGRIRDPNQLIPMIKIVIMAQIHMKIFKPFDRAIRETHCLNLIVINPFR